MPCRPYCCRCPLATQPPAPRCRCLQAEQMADMRVVPPLQAPTISEVVLCVSCGSMSLAVSGAAVVLARVISSHCCPQIWSGAAVSTSPLLSPHPRLQDHRNTLTLFAHFFKAAAAAEAATAAGSEASPERLMLKLSAGALALDFHLHAKVAGLFGRGCTMRWDWQCNRQHHACASQPQGLPPPTNRAGHLRRPSVARPACRCVRRRRSR